MGILFHPAASEETEAAHHWYLERSATVAARFRDELDRAADQIVSHPELGAFYLHGTRCHLLRRFPYLVVYHVAKRDLIHVVAVAHGRRRPGYWQDRLA